MQNLAIYVVNADWTICTDNWYTSLPLVSALLKKQTHLTCTIIKNRKGLPEAVTKHKFKKKEMIALTNEDSITVLNWKDQWNVFMLSIKHGLEMTLLHKWNTFMLKPRMVMFYNQGKKSVDVSDQMITYSCPLRKSMKWYRKLVIKFFLNTALVNCICTVWRGNGKNNWYKWIQDAYEDRFSKSY